MTQEQTKTAKPATFHRLRVTTDKGPRWHWAKDLKVRADGSFTYLRCHADGDTEYGNGEIHAVIGAKADLLEKLDARMNLTYGQLELVKDDL